MKAASSELLKHLHYAMGSAKEMEYQLLLAKDLGHMAAEPYQRLSDDAAEVDRMLSALIVKLKPDLSA